MAMEDPSRDNCCMFCYRSFQPVVNDEVEGKQDQFLLLLRLYFINDTDYGTWVDQLLILTTSKSSENVRNVLSPCADCSEIIKSFCEYYEEIQALQMKLKWKLSTLTDIVKRSEKAKLGKSRFQSTLKEPEKHSEFIFSVEGFKKNFVEKCTQKFRDSSPMVELRRCDKLTPERGLSTPITKTKTGPASSLKDDRANRHENRLREHCENSATTDMDIMPRCDRDLMEDFASDTATPSLVGQVKHESTDLFADDLDDFNPEGLELEGTFSDSDDDGIEEGSAVVGEDNVAKMNSRSKVATTNKADPEERQYTCCFCRKSSLTKYELITHQNKEHFRIQLDNEPNPDPALLMPPLEHGLKLKCPVSSCNEEFRNRQNLESHSLLHGSFKCQFCEETLSYAPDLAIHEALSHGKPKKGIKGRLYKTEAQTYSCPRCDIPAYSETFYIQHFLCAHMDLTMISKNMCCICKMPFAKSKNCWSSFRAHYKVNHDHDLGNNIYSCEKDGCGAYFLKEKQLRFHKFLLHNERKSKFPCPSCKKLFSSRYQVQRHGRKQHKLDFHFACTHEGCKCRFFSEEDLKRHVSHFHPNPTSSPCPQCGLRFKGTSYLNKHIRTVHAENKMPKPPIKRTKKDCSTCGRVFNSRGRLERHVLARHVGKEGYKYSCDKCEYKCITRDGLKQHERTHTKEKPYTCDQCGLRYAHRHNFKIHLKNKHGIV